MSKWTYRHAPGVSAVGVVMISTWLVIAASLAEYVALEFVSFSPVPLGPCSTKTVLRGKYGGTLLACAISSALRGGLLKALLCMRTGFSGVKTRGTFV